MDGLQGIENGPLCHNWLNGSQHISDDQMNMRLILASQDAIALDAVAALLEGHDPLLIPHLVTLHNDEMGCCDSRLIRVNGIKVGDEKLDFEIDESGLLSKYYDFDPPAFTVNDGYIENDQLCFDMSVDDEVTKIEVSIDGAYMDKIRIDNFEQFCFDLDTFNISSNSEIIIFVYDKYLNYSQQDVSDIITKVDEMPSSVDFKLYPNPAKEYIYFRYNDTYTGEVSVKIFDTHGRAVKSLRVFKSNTILEKQISVTNLNPGVYIFEISFLNSRITNSLIIQ